MLIVLSLYIVLLYLIFGKFQLLPWNRTWKSITLTLGIVIALVVVGALNYLAPSGRVVVQGASIEITPNVSGTVTRVAAKPNTPLKAGDLLFEIDPAPFLAEVKRLEAALVDANTAAKGLEAELDGAEAEIKRLQAQLQFGIQRRDDIVQLAERGASTNFQMQEAVSNIEQIQANLASAQALRRSVLIRMASEIGGSNASVVQAEQALIAARWNLAQTKVVAPADGLVTALTLRKGQRVNNMRPAMVFLPDEQLALTGVFKQSGAHAFELGSQVMVAMRPLPGTSFTTKVIALMPGTAEGTLGGATGALPSISELVGSSQFAVRLALPDEVPKHSLRLGMSGSATLITGEAGAIELLARVLFWLRVQANYL